ncbi:MAG: CaiB/BaiF CoA-transferase family protein [Pseudomonadota bacterium]
MSNTPHKPSHAGPLAGLRILEIAGLGPGPFAAMMLADMGADVLRVDRSEAADFGIQRDPRFEVTRRGRRSVTADLKSPQGVELVRRLIARADGLIEGFRPGVMERLGLGPDDGLAINPRLVYGRMTGWGQQGPMAQAAGHDVNYLALSGSLSLIGEAGRPPVFPGNMLGDYGGGGMYLAFGMVCALLEARSSGAGQVVDAAIVDGAASLAAYVHGLKAGGYWTAERSDNMVDGGAPYYQVYATSDGRYVAVGAIEKKFYAALLTTLGLDDVPQKLQHDKSTWPALKERMATVFASQTRDEWVQRFDGVDACFAPVLDADEAPLDAHLAARGTFVTIDGVVQPAPAPRFSRTACPTPRPPRAAGFGAEEALRDWGVEPPA